jgi:hypothetical protein
MKSIKIIVLSVLFILSLGFFSTSKLYAENPPNTYSVVTYQNGLKIETIYNELDGGIVQIRVTVYD